MIAKAKRFLFRLWKRYKTSRIDETVVSIRHCGKELAGPRKRVSLKKEMSKWKHQLPLVSCLMVTKNRAKFAKCALRSFFNQTYAHKELVIVDDGECEELADYVKQLKDERIRHIRLTSRNNTLGWLRNMSVKLAMGDLVCQWDDDDLSDPLRLEVQVCAVLTFETEACLLKQEMMWWPHHHRLAISTERNWEGSCVAKKNKLIPYPEIPKGEDTPVVTNLLQASKVVILDNPSLYVYVVHGNNTFETQHFDFHWAKAQETFEYARYQSLCEKLSLRMPIEAYKLALKDESRTDCLSK